MIAVSKYLYRIQGNNICKYVKRGFIPVSNKHCKSLQDMENISRKMSNILNTYSDVENSTESCFMNNGMRLVCDYKDSFTTTVGCFVPAGAMFETLEERGSVIFLEHLLFRRTKCHSQEQLECMLEEIGAKVAAVAMRDMFLFYGTVLSCNIDKLIQLFAEVVENGVIYDNDVNQEKWVILHELSQMESDREKVVMDYLPNIAYEGTALANSIYPETNIIKHFCTENLKQFRNRLLKTCNMTMVSTGSICMRNLQHIVGKHFACSVEDCKSPIEASNKTQSCTGSLEYRFSGAELLLRDDDNELGYVAIGMEGPSYKQREDYFALTVAKEIVGSWDKTYSGINHNAPFIAHHAYNTNLCQRYKSFFHCWAQSTSIWGCYFVCERLSLENMVDILRIAWMKLCTTITEKEVSRAVNQCIKNDIMTFNDQIHRFFHIVECIFGCANYEPLHHRILQYEKITADQIRKVSYKYIYDQSPVVVAVGRIENLPSYIVIKNGLYMFRY